jgi:hypothetical protein
MLETLCSGMACNKHNQLTNSMELSTTLEATTSCTATQEGPSILWNPKVCLLPHYQEPSAGPYAQLDQSSSYHLILSHQGPA